jgi:tRNA1(Val) A37 N6-methylase TrmN6
MVGMIPKHCKTVFEPTPGLGNIVDVLRSKNRFEIETPTDFFLADKSKNYDVIIMNPPFSSHTTFLDNAPKDIDLRGLKVGYHILSECMKMSDYVIALMPWFTIADSDVRLKNFKSFGIKSITPLPRKTFQYARIQTVVIELVKGYKKETIFKTSHF